MMTREKEAELLKTIQGMFPGADVVRLTGRPVVFTPCSNPDCCASPSHAPCGGEAKQPGIVELLNDYTERAAEF